MQAPHTVELSDYQKKIQLYVYKPLVSAEQDVIETFT